MYSFICGGKVHLDMYDFIYCIHFFIPFGLNAKYGNAIFFMYTCTAFYKKDIGENNLELEDIKLHMKMCLQSYNVQKPNIICINYLAKTPNPKQILPTTENKG